MSLERTYQERVENKGYARSNGDRREGGGDPVHTRVLASPPEPEGTDDKRGSADHCTIEALLRRREPAPLDNERGVMPGEGDGEVRPDSRPEPDTDEDEAGLADVEAPRANEDEGNRLEHWAYVSIA